MLEPYRVLDLTSGGALLCGRILGDLGADVLVVEDPAGHPSRQVGPFLGDDPAKSLFWYSYSANKRGITLNLEAEQGRELLGRLAERADFLVESYAPGYLAERGIGWEALRARNPRLVQVSITPFGQAGPYCDYQASDIVILALSGFLALCGDADRPPVRMGLPQALLVAGAEGAAGAMIAHHHRQKTGEGQLVDVSAQQAMTWSMMNAMSFWHANKVKVSRHAPNYLLPASGIAVRMVWPCRDGYVVMIPLTGGFGVGLIPRIVQWMVEEGVRDAFMEQKDWQSVHMSREPEETFRSIERTIGAFFAGKTVDEVIRNARQRSLLVAPINQAGDLVEHPQLDARGFWQQVYHPESDEWIRYPGSFLAASRDDARIRRRAPLIGEQNRAVYQDELGLDDDAYKSLMRAGVI